MSAIGSEGAVRRTHSRSSAAAPGQYVAAGTPIATLVRLHPLRLRVEVPERERAQLRARPAGAGHASRGRRATTPGWSRASVPRSPPTTARCGWRRRCRTIPAGCGPAHSPARRSSSKPSVPALVIPSDSVVSFAGVDKVFIVENGKAVERRVRLGRRQGELVEVEHGPRARRRHRRPARDHRRG